MRSSEYLFHLIKSLTTAEIRHFRQYVSGFIRKKDSKHLKLFEEMVRQNKYDEEKIRKKIFNKPILASQLPRVKIFLYELLLDSLAVYHADTWVTTRIRKLLTQAKVLMEKNLPDEARKLIARAKALAYKSERHVSMLDIMNMEEETLRLQKTRHNPESIKRFYDERKRIAEVLINATHYRYFSRAIGNYTTMNAFARDKKTFSAYEELMTDPILQDESRALSFDAKLHYHYAKGYYYYSIADFKKSLFHHLEIIGLFEKHTEQISENPVSYLGILDNVLNISASMLYDRLFITTLNKVRSFPEQIRLPEITVNTRVRKIIIKSYIQELDFYNGRGEFEKALSYIDILEKKLAGIKTIGDDIIFIYYNMGYTNFGTGNYSLGIKLLNKASQQNEMSLFPYVELWTRIVILLAHYELKNQEIIAYLVRSLYRFMIRHRQDYMLESALIEFIRNTLPKIKSDEQRVESFRMLKQKLDEISNDPFEKQETIYFDLSAWLESQYTGKTFGELIRERVSVSRKDMQVQEDNSL